MKINIENEDENISFVGDLFFIKKIYPPDQLAWA
jgi:hypothetical protein